MDTKEETPINPFERIRQERGWTWDAMLVAMDLPHTYQRKLGARYPVFRAIPERVRQGLILIDEDPGQFAQEYQDFRQAHARALRVGKRLG